MPRVFSKGISGEIAAEKPAPRMISSRLAISEITHHGPAALLEDSIGVTITTGDATTSKLAGVAVKAGGHTRLSSRGGQH
jgi:hypothetical protein